MVAFLIRISCTILTTPHIVTTDLFNIPVSPAPATHIPIPILIPNLAIPLTPPILIITILTVIILNLNLNLNLTTISMKSFSYCLRATTPISHFFYFHVEF